jgi:hypothetical protein
MNSFVFNSRVPGFCIDQTSHEEPSILQTYMNDSDMKLCSTLGLAVRPGNAELRAIPANVTPDETGGEKGQE